MILPVFKLCTLALKTLCKPIGKRIKKQAGLNPKFRQSIINVAQANHRLSTTLQRHIYNRATDIAIRPLNEEKAVQAAADLLGELFIFTVAGTAVIFEVQNRSRSEARKEELRKQELEAMKHKHEELAREVGELKHRLEELEQIERERSILDFLNFRHSKEAENRIKYV
ncbi:putative coiled-coil protein [Handroanthus impetiginosus]|uniref:Putative coiled-coil protein n=1 Tax=Handroanthus impetiginosus TaxID=429701 RepID=A0A2G9FXL5_9LAMI|nr:putative coiled-coil protein [Handroanthus impetiginosus]